MRRRLPHSKQAISIGRQVARMRRDFPGFKYSRNSQIPTWLGCLQPTETSPTYTVRIVYRFAGRRSTSPRAWVQSPSISADAPHRYQDGSLCLYYPPDRSWTPYQFMSETIVPWTALWLAFYEVWLVTGHWFGSETPHTGTKRR